MESTPNPNRDSSRVESALELARQRWMSWRRRCATVAVGALALVVGYGVVFGNNGLTAFAKKRSEARDLQRQMTELREENDRLRGHAERLANDPSAIEHEAREELHYMRPGEVIVTLPATPAAPAPAKP